MNRKSILASVILVPSLAIGGVWVYQANRFEGAIKENLDQFQKSLETRGISLTYESVRTSPLSFKAHLVKPTISGTLPDFNENWKGVKTAFSVTGEITAQFNPVTNTVTFSQSGESRAKIGGPVEFGLSFPESNQFLVSIKRKDYDFFGQKPFLCVDNIKTFTTDSKEISVLLNGQKFMSFKKGYSEIALNYQGKALDVSWTANVGQMEYFDVTEPLKGTLPDLDLLNATLKSQWSSRVVVGPEDQQFSFSVHVEDPESYIEALKTAFAESAEKDFGKLIPEGIRVKVDHWFSSNKTSESSLKGKFENVKGVISANMSSDLKVTDEWKNALFRNQNRILEEIARFNISLSSLEIFKNKEKFDDIMPNLPAFGKIQLLLDFEAPASMPPTTGKLSLDLKSDLYDLGVKGSLTSEGVSAKITTRNMPAMMTDLKNYVSRVSAHFAQDYPNEVKAANTYVPVAQMVLGQIMEPEGASEQSVEIQAGAHGVKVGKHDLTQFLSLFSGVMR